MGQWQDVPHWGQVGVPSHFGQAEVLPAYLDSPVFVTPGA